MNDRRKHRPPHGVYGIKEAIKAGQYDEAQKWCDENEEFYRLRMVEMQDLFIEAQRKKWEAA